MLSLDERMERHTKATRRRLDEGMNFIMLRGKLRMLSPYDARYMKAQTHEHSVMSADGHAWEISAGGQTRHCTRCLKSQCCPPDWVSLWGPFSREDIEALIRLSRHTATS